MRAVSALARRAVRSERGRFLVEGPQSVRELIRYAAPTVVDLYLTEEAGERHGEILDAARDAGVYLHSVSADVLAAMADATTPQGMIAVAQQPQDTLDSVLAHDPHLLVLLHEVRDPGNLGTVIRGADAAGADAVLISDASVDAYAPKVVRSTAGSLFHLPVVTGLDALATIHELARRGIRTLATEGEATTSLIELDLRDPHCWVMGTEARGLPESLAAKCDRRVAIPIYGAAESLNMAMAATICLYTSATARVRPVGPVPDGAP
ncbi:TrmH family RNA methyltransferase [Nostocoides jenkinsii]|uniref:Putative rRNA methyltransferase n=1 Tax=Nostocoides jenkinsii Ben 74 TaxID=1193518 RepID=A0A077MB17_9MICO|nr:RNA methyltransferase [Tetrasphaera jenkinsii]CCI53839.1 putative rRNA methyltransferase [Tetrasphaera jenkinsii Ben 74]